MKICCFHHFFQAQRSTRYSRKCISVELLRRLFPEETIPLFNGSANVKDDDGEHNNVKEVNSGSNEEKMRPDSCVGMVSLLVLQEYINFSIHFSCK
jgi:hypothetical protein